MLEKTSHLMHSIASFGSGSSTQALFPPPLGKIRAYHPAFLFLFLGR